MDGQEYLNQISASNRPVGQTKMNKILASKFFWVGAIGLVALIIVLIIGSLIDGGKDSAKNKLYALKLNINNTSSVVQDYQKLIKSSDLRSASASLVSVLSNTDSELTNYLTAKYNFTDKSIPENVVTEANAAKDALGADLFEARINGILDRVYTHKMVYEVAMLLNKEAAIINSSKDTELIELLTKSYNSLENLYNNFNDFSEANN
ncbi:hypothetical protein IKF34_02630 [Candidatus Saccharibacteria bacterium]|nr:hypothetical protein [Candidatus Saccharibacteria bacterium]